MRPEVDFPQLGVSLPDSTRQTHRVFGRILCFTTSLTVEFQPDSQREGFPLYSHAGLYPWGCGLCFQVELHGHLSFDAQSEVRILQVGEYERSDFDPTRFAVCSLPGFSPVLLFPAESQQESLPKAYRRYILKLTYVLGTPGVVPSPSEPYPTVCGTPR